MTVQALRRFRQFQILFLPRSQESPQYWEFAVTR